MDFSNIHTAVIAIAAHNLGWTKTVWVNEDGSLEWYGETGHPTDQQMMDAIPDAQTQFDATGALVI